MSCRSVRYTVSGRLVQVESCVRSVGLHLLVTTMYCAKTADLITMPFRVVGWAGQRNAVLDGVNRSFMEKDKFWKGNGVM